MKKLTKSIAAAALLSLAGLSHAAPVQFDTGTGSNNHYYEVIEGSFTWAEANAAAQLATHNGLTGYLATITSVEENNFITGLLPGLGSKAIASYFLGGSDVSVPGTFEWVSTGESFSASAVNINSFAFPSPQDPNYLRIVQASSGAIVNSGDLSTTINPFGYVIEFGAVSPVPVPAAALLFAPALLGFAAIRRKSKK